MTSMIDGFGDRKRLRPLLAAAALGLAAFLLYRALRPYGLDEIGASLRAISVGRIGLALAFTAGSFLCLAGSDALAVRYTGGALPYRKIALASFTSVSIGHTLGFAALSSGALRYRFYTAWGLSGGDVGRILLFCGVTAALGMLTAGGAAAVARADVLAGLFRVGESVVIAGGAAMLLAVAAYIALAARVARVVRIRRFEMPVPSWRLALGQIAVGTADMLLVSAVLHRMVTATADVPYAAILAAYVAANVAGAAAHVPGGLGVVEAVVVSLVPGAHVVGALIAFRAVYYLVPFALGCAAAAIAEAALRRRAAQAESHEHVSPARRPRPGPEAPAD